MIYLSLFDLFASEILSKIQNVCFGLDETLSFGNFKFKMIVKLLSFLFHAAQEIFSISLMLRSFASSNAESLSLS